MFGYIRPFKPYMRVFEFDIYQSVYCGLCKCMGRNYGLISRFTLSYDFAFLSLCDLSLRDIKLDAEEQRCIAHPLHKKMCAKCGCDSEYSAAAAIILTKHKLSDDYSDKEMFKKCAAAILLPFFKKPYKLAKTKCPALAPKIENAMKLQRKTENEKCEKCAGIDEACEPTAQMMKAVFGGLSEDKKENLQRFGYLLGRYIYICDALDDLKDDCKDGNYNPLLMYADVKSGETISKEKMKKVHEYTDTAVRLTLGGLADEYVKIDFPRYRDILDNIVYLGLNNIYSSVRKGTFRRKQKKGN